jgi:ribosomal protein S18 acetylase RimI-like enzyme
MSAAASAEARVLPYEPRFEGDVVEACWRTGLMGESLEGRGRFEDRRLFGMLFCLHFLRFEPGSCFLAVTREGDPREGDPREGDPREGDPRERAVGYIIGTADTPGMRRDFDRRMLPRIAARLLAYDWWRHPESFRAVLGFAAAERRILSSGGLSGALGGPEYPAQLHMNVLPGWQGLGLGGRLMDAFLASLRGRGCPGVFLETSDRNLKALPFYRKMGFEEAGEAPFGIWEGLPARTLAMRLRLDSARSYG